MKVLRFKNEDIDDRIQWVINTIRKFSIISPLGETGKGVKKEGSNILHQYNRTE
jgi:hypothetical protein